jgi:molecular chaperone Hsp33
MVQLRSSEIGDDLAYYLTDSEQIPSAVGVATALDAAGMVSVGGGFLVQALPLADEAEIEEVMARISTLPSLSGLLQEGGPKALLTEIFGDIPYTLLETHDIFFRCGCSREKVERALLSLGPDELHDMVKQKEGTEVTCEFCRQTYHLDASAIEQLAGRQ